MQVPTVMIKGQDGNPVRVNQSDYEADQAEDGAKSMALYKGKETEPVAPVGDNGIPPVSTTTPIPPAPSAPVNVLPAGTPVPPVQTNPSANQRLVAEIGKKFFVVDGGGNKITDLDGIDAKGYATSDAAWAAVRALPH